MSLLVPGTGQLNLGQRRGYAYLAVEAAGLIGHLERRHRGGELREEYQDLAWTAARVATGDRLDGDFEYYETLSKWPASGRFDADPGASGVQPETDLGTFNGSIWERARKIYSLPEESVSEDAPSYQQALAYYEEHAYGPDFLWDWSATPGALEEYKELIRDGDDRFRQATAFLGIVLANHVVSAVDAFISTRTAGAAGLRVRPELLPSGVRWRAGLRLRIGR